MSEPVFKVGDEIELDNPLGSSVDLYAEEAQDYLTTVAALSRLYRKSRLKMFDSIKEAYPELDGYDFIVRHDPARIVITRSPRQRD